jgi:uncharacterized protein YcbK (DUF882 family)
LASGALALGAGLPAWAFPEPDVRRVRFDNLHTGEQLYAAYWEQGSYLPDALDAVNRLLRDFRTGEVHPIEPTLLDLLVSLSGRVGVSSLQPFEVISGYRSPATNAALHAESGQVAAKSLHVEGKAIDIRLSGVQLYGLHEAALELAGGGVGYYPTSNFVHVDVGRVRTWSGT